MGIKKVIKKIIIKQLPKGIKAEINETIQIHSKLVKQAYPFINISFSQEGEDLILKRLLENVQNGFYVDIGAHHPFRFSNTYKFYLEGWRGINVDPLPGVMHSFNNHRPNDVNIEAAILLNTDMPLTYYMFNEPALNTFDTDVANDRIKNTTYTLAQKVNITPHTLTTILDTYLPKGQKIDFLSIDVEGKDLEVLQSNNWLKYLPTYIVAESLDTDITNDLNAPIANFLQSVGYQLAAKTMNSLIFGQK